MLDITRRSEQRADRQLRTAGVTDTGRRAGVETEDYELVQYRQRTTSW